MNGTPTRLDPALLAIAQDQMDQLRIVNCPFAPSLERVVAEHEAMVRKWPRLYRAPCHRPPPEQRVPLDPEGLRDLLDRAHGTWREVCESRATAWQLALWMTATRLEVDRVIAGRRTRSRGSRPPERARS